MQFILLILLAAALLPGCSKKPVNVAGQFFVVTKGRENINIGDLEVRVIPDGEFLNMAKATMPWIQEEVRKEAQFKADANFMTAFIKELLAMEEAAPNPIPELPEIRNAIVKDADQAGSIPTCALSGGMLKRGMGKLMSVATSALSSTTDADGRFTVSITGKTWFLAAGQREVGKETEQYLWVKGFEPQGDATSATLAIFNEADIDSEDGLYSLLGKVTGSSVDLDGFRKVDVSEQMKLLVARHREDANAAKAKVESEAAEAQAKLTAEMGAGRVGASVGVTLIGMVVMPFAFCPAGSFMMGSPSSEDGRDSDENQVRVTLSKDFWMAETEVTQAQWRSVMGSHPSNFKEDDLPVEQVSWDDAQEFIKKVNGSGAILEGWEMALPTEAQWEYACRAGEAGSYSGGTIDQVAWYDGNSENKTHPVGTKNLNAWGLSDMHGNVEEWCADWYGDNLQSGTDPSGASSGVYRVGRGGSWVYGVVSCRAAFRGSNFPDIRLNLIGFRPVLVPSE